MDHRIEHMLETDETLKLQRTNWTLRKVGWLGMLFMVSTALLSTFGTGILSHQKREMAGHIVEYERYGRFEKSTYMHFLADSENGKAVLYIPQQSGRLFEIEQISPAPDKQIAVQGYNIYTFLTDEPVHILLKGIPKRRGAIETTVKINAASFTISQHIFP